MAVDFITIMLISGFKCLNTIALHKMTEVASAEIHYLPIRSNPRVQHPPSAHSMLHVTVNTSCSTVLPGIR